MDMENKGKGIRALLFDLGDTIMIEETEEKDAVSGITKRADVFDGMVELLQYWVAQGVPIGLVADSYVGTCHNVLSQHGVLELFVSLAISEAVGVCKPDPLIFQKALTDLNIADDERGRVVMIGNNLSRDILGANQLGLVSVWIHWNERYPTVAATDMETPCFEVRNSHELQTLLHRLNNEWSAVN